MKNKGFTLIEMLAVIVVLGIIVGITTISIINIKEKQDQKNLENVISLILTAAKEYNVENRSDEVDVEILLEEELVDFDTSKYKVLKTTTVTKISCSNPLKKAYVIEFGGISYNDCGCEIQDDSSTDSLCK